MCLPDLQSLWAHTCTEMDVFWVKLKDRILWGLVVLVPQTPGPNDRFDIGGWEKVPQKDRVQSPQCQKRGSKRRHIHITQHRVSTLPGGLDLKESSRQRYGRLLSLRLDVMTTLYWGGLTDQSLRRLILGLMNVIWVNVFGRLENMSWGRF